MSEGTNARLWPSPTGKPFLSLPLFVPLVSGFKRSMVSRRGGAREQGQKAVWKPASAVLPIAEFPACKRAKLGSGRGIHMDETLKL